MYLASHSPCTYPHLKILMVITQLFTLASFHSTLDGSCTSLTHCMWCSSTIGNVDGSPVGESTHELSRRPPRCSFRPVGPPPPVSSTRMLLSPAIIHESTLNEQSPVGHHLRTSQTFPAWAAVRYEHDQHPVPDPRAARNVSEAEGVLELNLTNRISED